MLLGTHYRIGSYLYKTVLTKNQKGSLMNQYLFKWGNVLPDIQHEFSKDKHYIEFTLNHVNIHSEIIHDRSTPTHQRCISLGILCHFLSDYFCAYHVLAQFKKRSMLHHIIYEMKLHFRLNYCLLFPKQLQAKLSIDEVKKYTDIQNIIHSLQQDYLKEKNCIMNDILFALRASSIAIAHLQENSSENRTNELEMIWLSHPSSERSFQ